MHIAIQFSIWKNIEKALGLINDFPSGNSGSSYKSETLKTIVAEFSKQNKIDDLIESVNLIIEKSDKEEIHGFMAIELASIGLIDESLAVINGISAEREVIKNSSLRNIVKLLIEQGKLSEALALAKSIPNIGFSDSYRCEALKENAVKQLMIGNQEIYISLLTEIGRNSRYNQAIYDGLHQLSLRRKLVDVVSLIKDLLVYQPNPDQEAVKNVFLKDIVVELSNRAFFNEALFIHKDISNSDMQDDVLGLLAKQACQKGYYDFSVKTSQAIKNKVERIHTLRLM
jgi:hypothetical protein